MGGWIYLIYDCENGVYKIGVTRNISGNKRLKTLQTGNAAELRLVHSIHYQYPFRLEKLLHQHFQDKRVNGEWFRLDKEDEEAFNEICQSKMEFIRALSGNPFFMKDIK